MKPTFFIDIDGTIIPHCANMKDQLSSWPEELEPAVYAFFQKLYELDAKIVLATGRKISEKQSIQMALAHYGLQYDDIILGCGRGPRIIINDRKPQNGYPTAAAIGNTRNDIGWAFIDPGTIVSKTDYGWRQLIDYHQPVFNYKNYIHNEALFELDNKQDGEKVIIFVLSGTARINDDNQTILKVGQAFEVPAGQSVMFDTENCQLPFVFYEFRVNEYK